MGIDDIRGVEIADMEDRIVGGHSRWAQSNESRLAA